MSLLTKHIARRPLGNTGLTVSAVALGTVELGMDYGIPAPGGYGRPDAHHAIRLIQEAVGAGINLFDTSPGYGTSEELLGQALHGQSHCVIATKMDQPLDVDGKRLSGQDFERSIDESLLNSVRLLRRDALDIVQIHNATVEVFDSDEWRIVIDKTQRQGVVRMWGASVYSQEEALAAIKSGICQMIQVPYNVLDQQMAAEVFPLAEQAGVAIMVRSAFLKGVLTDKAQWLPSTLNPLKQAAEQIREHLTESWVGVSQMALRFCLSTPGVSTVLVGLRTEQELKETLDAVEAGELTSKEFHLAQSWALPHEPLLDPRCWPV